MEFHESFPAENYLIGLDLRVVALQFGADYILARRNIGGIERGFGFELVVQVDACLWRF